MSKTIVIITATRAEYGLLRPVIKKLKATKNIDAKVVATGTHLSPEFGMTVQEIEEDGISVDRKIEILLSADTPSAISKSMGLAMISFADYFEEIKPDAILILGDRYESLAVCSAAMNARIPIFHMHGGEATEGLIDEAVRHAITKMSYLHFASTEQYRKRIIQMGEEPTRVFNVGATGVENILNEELLTKRELEESLGFNLTDKYVVGTYHPVTLENNSAESQITELLNALEQKNEYFYLFTKANADTNGRIINSMLEKYEMTHSNLRLVDSLGMKRYLSALKYSSFVIGNSSSGLIEAPSLGVATINIGERQKGRVQGESIVNCNPVTSDIIKAIIKVEDEQFQKHIRECVNPYGNGGSSAKIVSVIEDYILNEKVNIKKKFYDIEFKVE